MASLKNISKANQRIHRERSQPESRFHLGQLEKKRDYKFRSKDYQSKKKELKELHRKALERNPDEFYFHMVNSRVQDGVHVETTSKDEDTVDQKKLMECQDLKYFSFKLTNERRKIEKLKANLHLLDCKGTVRNTHTIFVDSKDEPQFDPAAFLNTPPALINHVYNRRKNADLQSGTTDALDKNALKEIERERKKQYNELVKRIDREKELKIAAEKMRVKYLLSAKKGPKPRKLKSGSATKAPLYKWPLRRQR